MYKNLTLTLITLAAMPLIGVENKVTPLSPPPYTTGIPYYTPTESVASPLHPAIYLPQHEPFHRPLTTRQPIIGGDPSSSDQHTTRCLVPLQTLAFCTLTLCCLAETPCSPIVYPTTQCCCPGSLYDATGTHVIPQRYVENSFNGCCPLTSATRRFIERYLISENTND